MSFVWNKVLEIKDTVQYEPQTLEQQNKHENLIKFFNEHVFNNKNILMPIFNNINDKDELNQLMYAFSNDVKLDPQVIEKMYQSLGMNNDGDYRKTFKIRDFLPLSYFEKIENALMYVNHNQNHIRPQIHQKIIKLCEPFLADESEFLKLVNQIKCPIFLSHVYEKIKFSPLSQNREIFVHYLKSLKNYTYLPKNLKQDMEILLMGKKSKEFIEYFDKDYIFNLKDEELINSIIQNYPNILTDKKCPAEWKENVDYLLHHHQINSIGFSKVNIREICKNEENIIKLCNHYLDFYNLIPVELISKKIVLSILETNFHERKKTTLTIPQIHLMSRDFCLEMLEKDYKIVASLMPESHWQNKKFVLKVCELIDNNKIKSDILQVAPKQVRIFFDSFNVKEDFVNFMKMYFVEVDLKASFKEIPNTSTKKKNKL